MQLWDGCSSPMDSSPKSKMKHPKQPDQSNLRDTGVEQGPGFSETHTRLR